MEVIEDKTKVSIAYVLKESTGRILEEVPPTHPFVYIHGYNNIIPGLEEALSGRTLHDSFTVAVPSKMGYGPYRDDLVIEVDKAELSDIGEIWLGMELEMMQDNDIREFQLPETADEFCEGLNFDDDDESEGIYTIKEILPHSVIMDGNHPFAGKDLIFEVSIIDIEAPSFTELESGFPDQDEREESFDDPDFGNDSYENFNNHRRRWH